jgi:hypothetical protein
MRCESRKDDMENSDYIVSGSGSVYILTPMNQHARENLEAGLIEEAQCWAGGYAVEHRFIQPLVSQLISEGWSVSRG